MNIGFMGLGKLGLPCALAIESKGHTVCGYDINPQVKTILDTKKLPYREAGAEDYLAKSAIQFCSVADVVRQSEIIFVPIQTPHEPLYEGVTRIPESRVDFDYSHLKAGIKTLSDEIERQGQDKVVIVISTVLPGTVEREIKPLLSRHVKLCYNPFFIAMGTTITDFLNPEFILFGVDDEAAAAKAEAFYKTFMHAPFFKTAIKNAELIKVAYNTFIGMKVVFANAFMEICQKIGADIDAVSDAISLSKTRLISGKYLRGGMGDGGGCHPRDNIALSWLAQKLELSYDWFESVMEARESQTEWLAKLMASYELPKVILGKAFKEETNLTVGSPSVLLKNLLEEQGVAVTMYDPHIDAVRPEFQKSVFLIGTRHAEFAAFQFPAGSVVIDPWRYIPDQANVTVLRLGEGQDGACHRKDHLRKTAAAV